MVHARGWHRIGIVSLTLVAGVLAAPAASFTADLVQSRDGVVTRGKLFVSGARYRMELPRNDGPDVVVLADPEANVTLVLVPRYSMYVEMEADDGRALMNDPFAAMRRTAGRYEIRVEGEEACAGHPCRRERIHYQEQPVMTRWMSTEFGWPLKIRMAQQWETWVKLENPAAGPVDAALFAVPEDYAQADWEQLYEKVRADEEMTAKAEEWKRIRPRKQEVSRRLEPGSESRILLGSDVAAWAEVRYGSGEPYRWSVVPMRAGEALRPPDQCVFEGPATVDWLAGLEPDLLVARGLEGNANVSITLRGRLPLVIATSEVYEQQKNGGRNWNPRLEGWKRIRITLLATQTEGFATGTFKVRAVREGGTQTKEHELRLEPGQSMTLEWSSDDVSIEDFDLMLQTGSLRVEVVEDTRPDAEQSPF